ncbi:Invertase [Rhinocladiella similis]
MDSSLVDLRSGQLSPPYESNLVCRGGLRPQLHFSAPRGFINDPNGLFFDESEDTWHLYYQYNPTDTVAGNQHWGHATSHDLYAWDDQPIALSPASDGEGIYSGSVVLDPDNTSGFFPDQVNGVLAYYTLNTADEETQNVAYSRDGGYTFTKYDAGNPVLAIGSRDFRDPKVFWYKDRWVMVVACAREHNVGIYTSPDGLEWSHASNFSLTGLLGSQWECPNLVQMPVEGEDEDEDEPMWLMYISINPGAPQGGSIGQYFAGHFNGTHFTPVDTAARIADWAKDNYATQFFYGVPASHKQVSIAWASNWQYTNHVPTGPTEGWASVMTLPRTNWLRKSPHGTGYTLVSLPYNLDVLRSKNAHCSVERELGRSTGLSTRVDGLLARKGAGGSGAFLLDVNATGLDFRSTHSGSINFTIFSTLSGEKITGGVQFTRASGDVTVWIDRGGIRGWDNPFYTNRFSVTHFIQPAQSFDFQIVVDRSILEIFSMDGDKSATVVYYPEELLDAVLVELVDVNAEAHVQVHLHPLQPKRATRP